MTTATSTTPALPDPTLVATVAAEYDAHQQANAQRAEAEAALLDRVVEIVKPALRALATRPRIAENANRDGEEHLPDYAEWAGVPVGGRGQKRTREESPGRGSIWGERLYLCADGWRQLDYDGTWTIWEGQSDSWLAEETDLTTAEVVAGYSLDEILAAISTALTAQAGKREPATKAALARAEKIRAVTALLVGVSRG